MVSADGTRTALQRLQQIEHCLCTAQKGAQPIWGGALALEQMIALFGDESDWRREHQDLVEACVDLIRRVVPIVSEAIGGRIASDKIYLGLGSAGALLQSATAAYTADRIGYVRILMCELAIVLTETEIASRGHQLASDIEACLNPASTTSTATMSSTIH